MFETLSQHLTQIQSVLFPWLRDEVGAPTDKHYEVIRVLDMLDIERFVGYGGSAPVGRPLSDRRAIARAFVAKAVLNLGTTRQLLDRLKVDTVLRRICGWERRVDIASESVFSRAFAEFSKAQIPSRVHEALIRKSYSGEIVMHISRDATAIEGRETPPPKPEKPKEAKKKRGRPRKGEVREPKPLRRVEKQQAMTLDEMLDDLPKACDAGCKRSGKGLLLPWKGYKLHLDVADGGVPISAILTSASVHDSQAAIPLSTITEQRVIYLYELMDAAYDVPEIHARSREHGHVPIIDVSPCNDAAKQEKLKESRRLKLINFELPETRRYDERSTSERVNSALKNNRGGESVRVRGHAKVFCHLMFGVLVVAVEQLLRLVT